MEVNRGRNRQVVCITKDPPCPNFVPIHLSTHRELISVKLVYIACDTDFLIKITNDPLPKFDPSLLLNENELVIIPQVLREISGLESSKSPTTSRRARLAKRVMAERKIFKILNEREVAASPDTDNALLEFIKESPSTRAVATMDGSLLKRLEKMGLPYLTLSNGKMIARFKQRARYLTANKANNL